MIDVKPAWEAGGEKMMDTSVAAIKHPALFEAIAPASPGVRFVEAIALSLVAGLSAHISIRLPFTLVPITGQTFVILYAGALLGSRWGTLSVIFYLLEGFAGLPVFAPGGMMGIARLFGPTGGYLIGFVAAAWLVGTLTERGWDRSPVRSALMIAFGSLVVFAFGLAGLSRFEPADQLLALGFYPFLLGDLFKVCFAAAALPLGRRFID